MKISRIAEVVDIVCIDVDQSSLFGFFKILFLFLFWESLTRFILFLFLLGEK